MSMIPFFPNLQPSVPNQYWFDMVPVSEESQTTRYEDERRTWRESMKTAATDLQPLGKVLTLPGIETDDEDANDDSEDSDSHDEEDDETNDRIPVTQDFYSADDIQMNDDTSATAP
ncbi:anaphase-promoting complex subunit 15 isoform X2 [Scaptodrosophila lebanonensis]|uniref:Anaphase-promoting complex subunit 15 isoform X2 n=1 Tax=Drosophila lebanonensis TaxID=7225 RepID=A0A6J2TKJ5_DROLE|nr:anaphase-promoting complex subunit 15 isoform X2 [Scaptodrosophila lebanonensis]